MAAVPPLVIKSGQVQQLQAGDTLQAPVTLVSVWAATNGESVTPIVLGMPVYVSGADTVKRAEANALATACIGLGNDTSIAVGTVGNIAVSGRLIGTTAQWDAVVTGGSGGLTFNSIYYLDPANPGALTTTAPTTVGQIVQRIGRALSTTEMEISIAPPILL